MIKTPQRLFALIGLLVACGIGSAAAAGQAPTENSPANEVINGIAIMPGIERLSYISLRYYGIRESYDACIAEAKAKGEMPLEGDCADKEFEYQDARLNKAFGDLLAALGKEDGGAELTEVKAAQEAQTAWLDFHEKDCSARARRFGSTPGPTTLSICSMESTARRAQELEDWRSSFVGRP